MGYLYALWGVTTPPKIRQIDLVNQASCLKLKQLHCEAKHSFPEARNTPARLISQLV